MGAQLAGLLLVLLCHEPAGRGLIVESQNFHFHCDAGYSQQVCNAQLTRLSEVLTSFDLTGLGDWTWVLVRSQDWRPILLRVGRDPDSPAFTILERRQTFLEDALFGAEPLRSRTLLEKWRLPLDELLPFAVAHEMAHAFCHETDESKTNAYASQLRNIGHTACSAQPR